MKTKIILAVLLIALAISIFKCNKQSNLLDQEQLRDSIFNKKLQQSFKNSINKFGQKVSEQEMLILEYDKRMEQQLLLNSKLKSLNSQIKMNFSTKINDIIASFNSDTNIVYIVNDNKDTTFCIREGTTFSDSTKWYSLSGLILRQGVKFNSIEINNSFTTNIGKRKPDGYFKLFKQSKQYVEIIQDNPYTNMKSMTSIEIKQDKKFYNTTWFKIACGFVAGAAVTKTILK